MAEIQFATGKFQSFRATTKIHLGKLSMDVREGDIVQFDGQTIKISGVEHPYSELRAAIRVGWVVPEKDNVSNYKPKSANVKVRSALESKKEKQAPTMVSDDDRDVGPARRRPVVKADDPDEAKEIQSFSRELKNQDEIERPVGPSIRRASEMQTDSVGNEDAKPVGKIRSPAIMKTVVSDGTQAARETSRLDNAPPPRAILTVKGTDIYAAEAERIESIIDALNPEDRARMVAEQRKAQARALAKPARVEPKTEQPSAKALPKTKTPEASPKSKATPEPAKTESAKKVATRVPVSQPTTVEEVILQGDEIDLGNGVQWDKTLHWRTRAKIAAEQYGSNPMILAAIQAIEVPAVVTLIEERLVAISKSA